MQSAIAYLHFLKPADLFNFSDSVKELALKSETPALQQMTVEYAPYQKVPNSQKSLEVSAKIDNDEEFLSFVKNFDKPVEKSLAADRQLEKQEDLERETGISTKEQKVSILVEEIKAARKQKELEEKKVCFCVCCVYLCVCLCALCALCVFVCALRVYLCVCVCFRYEWMIY